MRNLSIIIPHYSKQDALQKTWDELQLQFHPDDRVYIVDDHSPDGVPDFDCPCTEVIRPPKHIPHIYRLNTLRNYGIQKAVHDACIILDPDCIPNPTFLDHARRIYDPSILYAGWITYLKEDGSLLKEDPRTGNGKSRWTDKVNRSCGMIWGGIMYFSKKRASLAGLFSTDYDGHWGAEDHVFGSACRNSGMRLRYEKGLMVSHQWHPKKKPGNQQRNIDLFRKQIAEHRSNLNLVTPYAPAVVVLMVTMMRPHYIDQNMRALFRHNVPLKVRLVNNGDQSKAQKDELSWWSDRWAVDYVDYKKQELLSTIRSNAMRDYSKKGYKYLILIDDDITPMHGSINNLILEMEKFPQYHALSGYIVNYPDYKRFYGGTIKKEYVGRKLVDAKHYYYYPVKPETQPTDYTSSGFTIIRLDKLIPYTDGWKMGWNDWDWSNEVTKQGLMVGVTGKAGAYHRHLLTKEGWTHKKDPEEYMSIRMNRARHIEMENLFHEKWGYTPKPSRPITEMKP